MKTKLIIAAVAFQVAVLAFVAGQREWILRTGRVILLRTAPLDPRDVMRGDYVRLEYEISQVDRALWRDGLRTNHLAALARRGTRVYGLLRVAEDGLAQLVALTDRRPAQGPFIRGHLEPSWGQAARVRWGIEAFFMEQGKARELEEQRTQQRRGVPLNMEVALGPNGIAVLKGYRWESLGITVSFLTTNFQAAAPGTDPRPSWRETAVIGARVKLQNHGPDDTAIVKLVPGRSLALVPDTGWGPDNPWQWAGEGQPTPPPRAEDLIVLKPGQSHELTVDFRDPVWFVVNTKDENAPAVPRSLADLHREWTARFRFEYRPPPPELCRGVPHQKLIWHRRLRSRAFSPTGTID